MTMRAGDMLIWDGGVLHGSGANNSTRSRHTLTLNYARGWLRTQVNQYLCIPRNEVLKLPGELQRDLGYQPTSLGLGKCDNQDPLHYLQRMQVQGDGSQYALGREAELDDQRT